MRKKITLRVTFALIFISIAVSAGITAAVCIYNYNNLIEDLPQRTQLYSSVSDIDDLIRNNYYGEIDSEKLNAELVKGYVSGLSDEYSVYLSAENYADYSSDISGNLSGTGLEVSYDSENLLLTVTGVEEGSPGQEAGIQIGDIINSIENKDVTSDNVSELVELLEGDKLTSVSLELYRLKSDTTDADVLTVNVSKGYKAKSCFYSINGTIGYIMLTAFYDNTASTFSQAIDTFNESGVTGIVIDVRNNSSNNIDYAAQVIDLIVPLATEGTGEIATTKNSSGDIINVYAADSVSINIPIAVLINDRTEGAGELLACDLRDFGKAKLYGETTCGHGTLQKIFELDDGSAVLLTVAKIYPYISDCYDTTGIEPDVSVVMSDSDKSAISLSNITNDPVYTASLEAFK